VNYPQIRLEPLALEHVPFIMEWVNDQAVMGMFAGRQTTISEQEEVKYVEAMIASKNDFVFSVFDADTNEYVGQCSINSIYWPASNGRIFVAITGSQQHKGYSKPILEKLIDAGFTGLALHKLWLIVREENIKAQEKYLKAGFQVEGILKDEYFVHGRYYNMVRMAYVNPRTSST